MSSKLLKMLTDIPGVTLAVFLDKNGIPVSDDSFAAENLAAHAINMTMIGSQLGNIFGIGAVKRATVQGKERHLLMFNSKEHILSIATQGEIQLGVADVEIRKVLSSQK